MCQSRLGASGYFGCALGYLDWSVRAVWVFRDILVVPWGIWIGVSEPFGCLGICFVKVPL